MRLIFAVTALVLSTYAASACPMGQVYQCTQTGNQTTCRCVYGF